MNNLYSSSSNATQNDSSFYFSNYTGYYRDFYVHYYYYYVHPVATLVGSALNVVCAIVFAQKRLRTSGPFFQYSLVNSIGAAVALLLFAGFSLTRCGPFCSYANTYWSQQYEIYAVLFVDNSLYFASSLVQISISFQLYFTVNQRFKRLSQVSPIRVVSVVLFVSFSLGLSIMFSFKIVPVKQVILSNGSLNEFYIFSTDLDYTIPILVYLAMFTIIVSNKIFLVVLVVINVLLYVELRRIMKRKQQLTNNKKSNSDLKNSSSRVVVASESNRLEASIDVSMTAVETITQLNQAFYTVKSVDKNAQSQRRTLIMVLWVSGVFSTSRFVSAVCNLVLIFLTDTVYNWWASAFNFLFIACLYASYFFVYMNTNKLFKKTFYRIFLRKRTSK